ncbi:MAG: sulfotransferase domain-containing protein [Pseudomonadales bacterium]
MGGTDVARKIDRYLPGSKIIFLLRDPVTRAQSHLRFLQSKSMNIGPERTMKEVLLEAQLHVDDADIWKAAGGVALSRKMYLSGCYHRYLQQYLSVLEASRIGIFFYEELQASPLRFMEGVCAFLGIDPGYYRNFNFQVENKTRFVRYGSLHRQMNRLNNQAEPLLNQYPKLRRLLRAAYYRINQEVEIEPPPDDVKIQDQQLLLNSYEKDIQQLAKLLESRFPELELPAWLHRTAPMRRHAHAVPVAADRKDQPRASHAPRVGISMSRTAPPKSK